MDVLQLQTALKAAGFDPGALDGLIGPKTIRAVKAFQAARGLLVDGLVGPVTIDALGGKVAAPAEPLKRPYPGIIDLSSLSKLRVGTMTKVRGFCGHHTAGGGDAKGVISVLNGRNLGVQWTIDRAGNTYLTLPDRAIGYHILPSTVKSGPLAGLSNATCMGVEIIAKDDRDVLPVQVEAGIRLCVMVAKRWPGIVFFGHGEVNPGHRQPTEGMSTISLVRGPDFRIKPELLKAAA